MKFVNVRELTSAATKLLREEVERGEKVVITRRGKPIGIIVPYTDKITVAEALLEEAESLLRESRITENDLQRVLKKIREKVYA